MNINLIKKFIFSPSVLFILTRYFTYFLLFANSILIAIKLGPYYLGVWGFLQLILQYINQLNLGIHHSVNVLISVNKGDNEFVRKIVGASITLVLILSLLLIIFFISNNLFELNIGTKFELDKYVVYLIFIGCIGYFNSLFSNIFRVYGNITYIAINQSILPFLMLNCILFFKSEALLYALLFVNVIAWLICFFLFIIKRPISFQINIEIKFIKVILRKGFFLFIYNTSFYFILLTTRTFISSFYKIEDFGLFTFAFSLSQAIMLFFEAIAYLIFPKVLNKFASSKLEYALGLLNRLRKSYITLVHLLVNVLIVLYPLVIVHFPEYSETYILFGLISLSISLYSNSFGLADYLMAKGKEIHIATVAFFVLVFNFVLSYLLIRFFNIEYQYLILATMISYFIYNLVIGIFCYKTIVNNLSIFKIIGNVYPIKIIFPYLLNVVLFLTNSNYYYHIIVMILFLFLNKNSFILIFKEIKKLVKNPNIINI